MNHLNASREDPSPTPILDNQDSKEYLEIQYPAPPQLFYRRHENMQKKWKERVI